MATMNDETRIPSRADNPDLVRQILIGHGGPAFLRRSSQVASAYDLLLTCCRQQRHEWLNMVGMRLATLHALAGGWNTLRPLLSEAEMGRSICSSAAAADTPNAELSNELAGRRVWPPCGAPCQGQHC
jgi:hypothetical protein